MQTLGLDHDLAETAIVPPNEIPRTPLLMPLVCILAIS